MKNFYKSEHSFIFQNDFCDWETGELLSPIQTQNYTIIQVAELYYNNAFSIQDHIQYCDLEITFPTKNGLNCATENRVEKLRKFEVYLSFKGEKHQLNSRLGCRFQTIALNFTNPKSKELLYSLRERFLENRKLYIPDLSHFLAAIIDEFISTDAFFLQSLDGLITAVLVRLTRHKNLSITLLSNKITPTDIYQYIDKHFLDICSLEELAITFGYTYGHICKIFKKEFNITPLEHLLTKKMTYAALLLSQGQTLSKIAEITGYSTPYNLSRALKKYFGTTPSLLKNKDKNI